MLTVNKSIRVTLLIFIVAIGFLIRIARLDSVPSGFFCDEAATGYNALKILTTGKDAYGVSYPIFFQALGTPRAGLPFYVTVPFIWLFGLSEFATRLPSVLIGTMTIPLIYLVSKKLFTSNIVASLASLFLALSPWHIHFSRYGDGNIYIPFGVLLGLLLFILALESHKSWYLIGSSIVFAIFCYTYYPAFAFIPIFVPFLYFVSKVFTKWQPTATISLFVFIILFIPFGYNALGGSSTKRLSEVTKNVEAKSKTDIRQKIIQTYVDHYLPEFLFLKGDIGYRTHFITRFSVRGMGQLYWIQLPFIVIGLIWCIKNIRHFGSQILLIWLILYPLGSTIALFSDGGGPFATRSIVGVGLFQILTGVGFLQIFNMAKKPLIQIAILLLLVAITGFGVRQYLVEYFVKYPTYSSDFWGWQFGARDVMAYFLFQKDSYADLFLSDEFNAPDIFPKFYDPANECQDKCKIGGIEKYSLSRKQLFALSPERVKKTFASIPYTVRYTINYQSGIAAFLIIEPQVQ